MNRDARVGARAGVPTHGRVRGVITIVQEDRFRLEDTEGHGYLMTLGRHARASIGNIHEWCVTKTPVVVRFRGAPDLGAVATDVEPHAESRRAA